MKILIHPETPDGKPIAGSGRVLSAKTPAEVVELMRLQTPFSAEMNTADYRAEVMRRVEGPDAPAFSEDAELAAAEFLTRLAVQGRLEFLPNGGAPEPARPPQPEGDAPCADKQA